MFWENAKACQNQKVITEQLKDKFGEDLVNECNTEVKKRILRRLHLFEITEFSELTNLVIEGALVGEKILDSDRRFIERFSGLEVLALNDAGI